MALKSDDFGRLERGRDAAPVPTGDTEHFRRVMEDASPAVVGHLLAEVFRSGRPLPFAALLGRMFGAVSPSQQIEILGLLLEKLSEATVTTMPYGEAVDSLVALSRGGAVAMSSQQLDQITPDMVQHLARLAEWHDPAVIERIGVLCAKSARLIAALGEDTLAMVAALLDREEGRGP